MSELEKRSSNRAFKIVLLGISYLLVGFLVWKTTVRIESNPARQQVQAQKEINRIVEKVGTLMLLPTGEVPQVALVQDAAKLKETEDFFKDAEDGDKVLVYAQARKAIIYRESSHQIINVLLNLSQGETSTLAPVPEATTESTTSATTTN